MVEAVDVFFYRWFLSCRGSSPFFIERPVDQTTLRDLNQAFTLRTLIKLTVV